MLKHVAVLATILLATAPASAALIEFTGQTINEGPGPAPGGRCELPSLTFTMGPAAGPVTGTSNLGDFTPELSHCIILPPPAAFTDGLFDYEFGDGDVLSGTYVGSATLTATAGLLSVDQLFTITGGSGRFAGASGGLIGEGTIEFRPGLNPLGIVNFSGTINIVPEPAAFGLLGIGAGAIVFRRSRKKLAA